MITEGNRFEEELRCFGPKSDAREEISLAEAEAYCRRLARSRYENFSVISWLLPRRLRQSFCNVYAYCRWADDLADEVGDSEKSEELLDWWESLLEGCYNEQAAAPSGAIARGTQPVFVALRKTIEQFSLARQPFADLLTAFRQDQRKARYEEVEELLDYCRYSACPVGRIVLQLGDSYDEERAALSDSICTGLQWINFWQDASRDFDRGRVYLPRNQRERFHYTDEMLENRSENREFKELMAHEVDRAESFFMEGRPLLDLVSREIRPQIELFWRGGMEVVHAIRQIDFEVWNTRPTVSRWAKLCLIAGCWRRTRFGTKESTKPRNAP